MIFASVKEQKRPCKYPAAIEAALEWIAGHDLAHMEAGSYEIQGKDLYVMIQDITTQPAQVRRPERHDNYLDIQYIVSGVERMGYVPYTGKESVQEDPEGKDVTFYQDLEGEAFLDVAPGCYCIFFSSDIHRPGCAAGEPCAVRKAVVKVKQSLLSE